jgi:hypothetical protein|tara:strand:+ start:1020 stop:1241 length:222 start_codon:yes stop_codon:yes gene_type:complete
MLNTEYEREYVYDIDAYLIASYPLMDLTTRRSICRLTLEEIDDEMIEDAIDEIVLTHALDKMQWLSPDKSDDN